jgi:hypothetical protein
MSQNLNSTVAVIGIDIGKPDHTLGQKRTSKYPCRRASTSSLPALQARAPMMVLKFRNVRACNQPLQNSNQYLLTHLSAGRFAHEQHLLHLLFPFAWVEISEGQSDK